MFKIYPFGSFYIGIHIDVCLPFHVTSLEFLVAELKVTLLNLSPQMHGWLLIEEIFCSSYHLLDLLVFFSEGTIFRSLKYLHSALKHCE